MSYKNPEILISNASATQSQYIQNNGNRHSNNVENLIDTYSVSNHEISIHGSLIKDSQSNNQRSGIGRVKKRTKVTKKRADLHKPASEIVSGNNLQSYNIQDNNLGTYVGNTGSNFNGSSRTTASKKKKKVKKSGFIGEERGSGTRQHSIGHKD